MINIDGITITVERETLKVTLARWGQRVVIRFVAIEHLLKWMYLVGTVKHEHPHGILIPIMAQLAHAHFGHLLHNDFY
jgi:hypothetical protein